jgi:hypothetical protein
VNDCYRNFPVAQNQNACPQKYFAAHGLDGFSCFFAEAVLLTEKVSRYFQGIKVYFEFLMKPPDFLETRLAAGKVVFPKCTCL